ncbi:MAG TPA: integrin [Deltaproteobacteria bacterium]|nr:integrin [Deltaproteobacteria bacterium]
MSSLNFSSGEISVLPALAFSSGQLSPTFSSEETDYSSEVSFFVHSVHITAVAADPDSSLSVNGESVNSGELSSEISLAEGVNPIEIVVSRGGLSTTYTLRLERDSASQFAEQAYLKASQIDESDWFGARISLSGDILAVGVPSEDSGNPDDPADNSLSSSGAVYIFERSGNEWIKTAYLKASNLEENDFFGGSVSLSGNTLAVGAPSEDSSDPLDKNDNNASKSGAVYIFERDGNGAWSETAYLKASNLDNDDLFGGSISLSGNTLAVGATGEDSGDPNNPMDNNALRSGAVYVFERDNNGAWSETAYLKASNIGGDKTDIFTHPGDEFGSFVSLSGGILAVGVPHEDSRNPGEPVDDCVVNPTPGTPPPTNCAKDSGAAYIFERDNNGNWTETAFLKPSITYYDGFSGFLFGFGISVSGDTLAVGAFGENFDGEQNYGGAVYVFQRQNNTWIRQAYLKALGQAFGYSVGLSGDTLAVGNIEDRSRNPHDPRDTSASRSGAVYTFQRSGEVWAIRDYIKASNLQAGDWFGSQVSLSGDTLAVSAWFEDSGDSDNKEDNSALDSGAVYVFTE